MKVKTRLKVCLMFAMAMFLLTTAAVNKNILAENEKSRVIAKSVRLVKDRKVTQIIKAMNSNKELLANATISVSIDEPSVASIRLKDATSDDKVDDAGNVAVTKTDASGQKAFIIKGLREGSTAIHLDILPEGGSESDTIKQVLNVKVIELKIEVQGSW